MAQPPWWIEAVKGMAVVLGVALVMGWLSRRRTTPARRDPQLLAYPRGMLAVGGAVTAFFVACMGLALLAPTRRAVLLACFAPFVALGAYVIIDYLNTSFRLEADGFRFRLLLKGRGSVRWTQIERVAWSPSGKWFIVHTIHGDTVRISAALYGLPALATALLANLESHRFTPQARNLLVATAAGNPPALWG